MEEAESPYFDNAHFQVDTERARQRLREATHWMRHTQGEPVCWFPFSEYELRNLASALGALFPSRVGVATRADSLNTFNSGDWVALAENFRDAVQHFAHGSPGNRTPEQYIADVNAASPTLK